MSQFEFTFRQFLALSWPIKSTISKKSRQTAIKRIVELLQTGNSLTADVVCKYGRELSYEESFLRLYYEAKFRWEYAVESGKEVLFPWKVAAKIKSDSDFKILKNKFEDMERMISQMFMRAVDSHDGERILNLAKAVSFFKDKRPSSDFIPADRERALLLFIKTILDHSKEKIPIRMVAQFLILDDAEARKKMKTPADGFSALRRKCLQLGVPLAESRKRKKK